MCEEEIRIGRSDHAYVRDERPRRGRCRENSRPKPPHDDDKERVTIGSCFNDRRSTLRRVLYREERRSSCNPLIGVLDATGNRFPFANGKPSGRIDEGGKREGEKEERLFQKNRRRSHRIYYVSKSVAMRNSSTACVARFLLAWIKT